MEKVVKFTVDKLEIDFDDYSNDEFAIAKLGFLSDRPNSHELDISAEVLQENAKSVLGKWVVADMVNGEPTTHTAKEYIVGQIPQNQTVEFVQEGEYLRAYVYSVISKIYAKDFCEAFALTNKRAVSVEMKVVIPEDDEHKVLSFNIVGVTVLGMTYRPSCPKSDISFVRFSEEANDFFVARQKKDSLEELKHFAERNYKMAEKYKIDKSKEAMSETPWGDVDKTELRNKIMEAENKTELVKACYMLVEDGWEEAPSEKLKYPVMEIKENTLVYNRYGLSSALAYAKQEKEQAVINKVEAIYKKLDLEETDGKEEKKMSEIEFSAVNIGDLWGLVWNYIDDTRHWDYCVEGIYEQDNQKFAILKDREQKLYRLDFSLTEEGFVAADEVVEVKEDFVVTDEIKKFAEVDDAELMAKYTKFADEEECEAKKTEETKLSYEELEARIAELEKGIEERENIIMDKDSEIAALKEFKQVVETKEKASKVEAIMSEVKNYLTETEFAEVRQAGLDCENFDAWANNAKAVAFSAIKKTPTNKETSGVFSFAAPVENVESSPRDIWEKLKKNYN